MADVVIPYRFRVKRDTAAAFTAANTLLLSGEIGLETDTRRYKIGNGTTAWNSLAYSSAATLADTRRILDLLGSTAEGDIIYKGASGWTRLPKGVDGRVLGMASGLPAWVTGGGGGGGAVIQVESAQSSAAESTTSTGIPVDNTIPQNTEGVALSAYDVTITPTSASSVLRVRLSIGMLSKATSGGVVFACFRDSGADAVYATTIRVENAAYTTTTMEFDVAAASTSATTFSWRWGVSTGTGFINRTASGNFFGGVTTSVMSVSEIAP